MPPVNNNRVDFQAMVNTTMLILSEDKKKKWNQARLSAELQRRLNSTKPGLGYNVFKTLIASGKIGGQLDHGGRASWIHYKDPAAGLPDVVGLNEHDALKAQLVEAQRQLKAANEAVLHLNDQVKKIREESTTRIVAVQLNDGPKTVKTTKGIFHKEFERILKLVRARMNVFIYGPTGCGKSHICAQLAETLKQQFGFVSCTAGMSEGVLGGRLLPVGKQGTFEYVISEFIKCFEEGGIFLLDEMDAADPNVLLLVNAALANGKVAVPNRPSKPYAIRHKDFVCVAAANTVGTGADRMYSGRNKLDSATLDRFQIGKVFMDYDEQVEAQLCPDDELRSRLLQYRYNIRSNRLERAMSTRFMKDAYVMKSQFEFTMEDIDLAFFQGWREDEISKVKK